jgi:hypothetical protein
MIYPGKGAAAGLLPEIESLTIVQGMKPFIGYSPPLFH